MNGLCDTCGEAIEGVYATIGDNIEPYVPYKEYHLGCSPPIKPLGIDIEDRLDAIFDLMPATIGAGWVRLDDEGDLEVFIVRVPKRSEA